MVQPACGEQLHHLDQVNFALNRLNRNPRNIHAAGLELDFAGIILSSRDDKHIPALKKSRVVGYVEAAIEKYA